MRVGLRIPPCAPVPEIAALALEAERAGFDEVWFPDSQLLWRDVFAVAAAAAAATSRVTLGTAVTNVVTRHPAVVASAARTVAELAPGRFVLGVGVGDSAVGPVGLRASTGAVSAFCRLTDDVPRASRELKPICARIAQNGGAPFLALAGVHVEVPEHLPGVYPDLVHAEDWEGAVRACDPYVPDDAAAAFAREFCLYGTASEIADRLASVRDTGADAVFLQHVGSYDLPHALLAEVSEEVLPLLEE